MRSQTQTFMERFGTRIWLGLGVLLGAWSGVTIAMVAGLVAVQPLAWLLLTWLSLGSAIAYFVYRQWGEVPASRVVGFVVWMCLFPPVAVWIVFFAGRWPQRH